jgi:hypothetical protein
LDFVRGYEFLCQFFQALAAPCRQNQIRAAARQFLG